MKVVFLSNYYNHHQAPFSEAMDRLTDGNYVFIETEKMSEERKELGWNDNRKPDFVLTYDTENAKKLANIIDEADVLIIGNAPIRLINKRLDSGKLTFWYTERWYKKGFQWWKWPVRLIRHYLAYGRYKNTYMLCASAYTAADCAKTGLFFNRTYKWGYFPEVKCYDDIDRLIELKHRSSILWVARFIELKHPEVPLTVAKRLKEEGYSFSLELIGNGVLKEKLSKQIEEYGLNDCVRFLGIMEPEQVRDHMEKSEIFLFSSDFNEGWGAVLNESMNSACAVVASHAIGSVPYLLTDGKNGLIYENGNTESCYQKVKYLLEHSEERKEYGRKAYSTLCHLWNAEVAAERLIELSQKLLNGEKQSNLFSNGPCSNAKILKNDWYKEHRGKV